MKILSLADDGRNRRRKTQWFVFIYAAILLYFLSSAAHAANVTLEWDPGPSTAYVSGYKVYYGTNTGSYEHVLNIGNHTSCEISGLTEGKRYYFSAATYDAEGNESQKSGVISYIAGSGATTPDKIRQIAAVGAIIGELLLKEN